MDKITAVIVIIIGILLILPLIGITQLGNIIEGFAAWAIALVLIITGILELVNASKKKKIIDKD